MTTPENLLARASEAVDAARRQLPAQRQLPADGINLAESERTLSALGGGALALLGLGRQSSGGLALAALGGYLVYRGLSGRCALYQALGVDTAHPNLPRKPLPRKKDLVMQASEDSFPASDPPAWGESGVAG